MTTWDEWIGKTTSADSYLDPVQVRKLEATLDRIPTLESGDVVPPAWHWLYFHEIARASDLGRDGHTRLGVTMPNFPLPRRMWAGGKIQWLSELILGKDARRESKILSIEEKQGRTGQLIFVTVEHKITQANLLCIREEHNIVYREEVNRSATPTNSNAEAEQAKIDSDFSQKWKVDEATLFRYSALTFNSHRIHYDSDYAREVEGYSGLIVHGPLMATLMLDLAKHNERSFNEFNYRAKSPITLPSEFEVRGLRNESGTELWVASESGALVMHGILN